MNRCIFQFWEESIINDLPLPDGCSIHTSELVYQKFVNDFYIGRTPSQIPTEYSRIVGTAMECFISDELFERLGLTGTIRLNEIEKNNLIQLEEIIFKE